MCLHYPLLLPTPLEPNKGHTKFLVEKCHPLDRKITLQPEFPNPASFVMLKWQTKSNTYFILTNKILKQTTKVCLKTWSRRAFPQTVIKWTFSLLFYDHWHWRFHYIEIDSSPFGLKQEYPDTAFLWYGSALAFVQNEGLFHLSKRSKNMCCI